MHVERQLDHRTAISKFASSNKNMFHSPVRKAHAIHAANVRRSDMVKPLHRDALLYKSRPCQPTLEHKRDEQNERGQDGQATW
jgi:hypothetical protein